MPYSDEFCLIHGYTLRYDSRSGFDVCDACEEYDPTPWCHVCGSKTKAGCDCPETCEFN